VALVTISPEAALRRVESMTSKYVKAYRMRNDAVRYADECGVPKEQIAVAASLAVDEVARIIATKGRA
jgi:hypothetical protein